MLRPVASLSFPDLYYFSFLGNEVTAGVDASRNLCCPSGSASCTANAEEVLAFVEINEELPLDGTAQVEEAGTQEVFASGGGFFTADNDADGVEDSLDGDWAFAVGPADALVKIIVTPTRDADARDFDLKLESNIEVKKLTFGIRTAASGGIYELLRFGPSVDSDTALVVDPSSFPAAGDANTLYLVLPGTFPSDVEPSPETTLIHVPGPSSPSRVFLGTLRVPASQAGTIPTPTFSGASDIMTPVIELPGGGSFDIAAASLSGSTVITEDSDGDGITNDTENCVFFPNPDQLDGGGLNQAIADGFGDACQCGDLGIDPELPGVGVVSAADVMAGAMLVAGAVVDPVLQAAAEALCSVSGDSAGAGDPTSCNIKDLVVLQQATAGSGNLQSVCLRAVAASLSTGN